MCKSSSAVHLSLRTLVNRNNNFFDDSDLLLAFINLACSEVLYIFSHVTHTHICTAQNENVLLLGNISKISKMSNFCEFVNYSCPIIN